MRTSRPLFRALVAASAVMLFTSVTIAMADARFLPAELAQWNAAHIASMDKTIVLAKVLLTLVGMVASLAGLIGLFLYRRWAAWVSLGVLLLFTCLKLDEPSVMSGPLAFSAALHAALQGAVLALAFLTDVLDPKD